MAWSKSDIKKLEHYWSAGLSASQIGVRLNKPRNAVIGKVHRLGLAGPANPAYPMAQKRLKDKENLYNRLFEVSKRKGILFDFILNVITEITLIQNRINHNKIKPAPGSFAMRIAEFCFSKKTFSEIFQPTITDMQKEYFDALQTQRKWKSKFVILRGHWSILSAMLAFIPLGIGKKILEIWRLTQ